MKKQLILLMIFYASTRVFISNVYAQDTTAKIDKENISVQKIKDDTTQRAKRTPEQRGEALANRMKEKLSLNDEQVSKLKVIFTKQEKAIESYMEEVRKSQQQMQDELARVLSSEQMTKFKEMQGRPQSRMPTAPKKEETPTPATEKK